MAKRSLYEQFDDAVEALMNDPDAPRPALHPRLAALLRIAADLRDLPRPDFKARLKAKLSMAPAASQRASRTREAPRATTRRVRPVREGFHTATPCLIVRDAPRAIEFYKQVFGATELMRLADPSSGKLWHAEVRIGDSRIAIADEEPQYNLSPQSLGGSPVIVQIYVEDVDAVASQAVAAGAKVVFPVADQFYGDRAGRLADPFGHIWIVATHKEDVSLDEMRRRAEVYATQQAGHVAPKDEATISVKPSREGFRSLRPFLQVEGAAKLIDFLTRAFGAEELFRSPRPDGTIGHAEVKIEASTVEMGDATPEHKATSTAIHVYVEDADAVYRRALRAGATSMQKPTNQDYGDREAGIKDPFGNHWYVATPLKKSKGVAKYVPEGLPNLMPYLHPRGAPQLIDFLKQAFGAEEVFRAQSEGIVHHAKVRVADSIVEMGEAHGMYQPMASALHLHVDDTDAVYERALQAGAASIQEPTDRPWGQRSAGVKDRFGNLWWIAAPLKEGAKRAAEQREEATGVKPIPEGYHTVTPYLMVQNALKLLDFLKHAFAATEVMRTGDPTGHFHAEVKIGDSVIMMGNAGHGAPEYSAQTYLYVADVDAVYKRALAAGASSMQEPTDQDYGDRNAFVKDPFGNIWYIATHTKDVPH